VNNGNYIVRLPKVSLAECKVYTHPDQIFSGAVDTFHTMRVAL
jgi:hypothetical protein